MLNLVTTGLKNELGAFMVIKIPPQEGFLRPPLKAEIH
jgi:hypothetical protein